MGARLYTQPSKTEKDTRVGYIEIHGFDYTRLGYTRQCS
jgi:hypothetical protein